MKINGNFRRMVRNFMYGSNGVYKSGDWQIANGGYDLWFEIYYKGRCFIRCVAGVLSGEEIDLGRDFDGKKIILKPEKYMNILVEESEGVYHLQDN